MFSQPSVASVLAAPESTRSLTTFIALTPSGLSTVTDLVDASTRSPPSPYRKDRNQYASSPRRYRPVLPVFSLIFLETVFSWSTVVGTST